MTWPVTRLTNYAKKSRVKSADLNSIQDTINILHAPFSIAGGAGYCVQGTDVKGADGSLSTGAGASRELIIPLVFPVGFKVFSIIVIGQRLAANNISYNVYEEDNAAGGKASIGSASGTVAGREAVSMLINNYAIVADKTYFISAVGGANGADGVQIYMAKVTPGT